MSVLPATPSVINGMTLSYLSMIASSSYAYDFRTGQSLYARGALMAYYCDQYIINTTAGKRSLRDGIYELMQTCQALPPNQPFDINQLAAIIMNGTKVDCSDIINQWLGPYPS
jgi:predicted metalloprotease with PDZ domain